MWFFLFLPMFFVFHFLMCIFLPFGLSVCFWLLPHPPPSIPESLSRVFLPAPFFKRTLVQFSHHHYKRICSIRYISGWEVYRRLRLPQRDESSFGVLRRPAEKRVQKHANGKHELGQFPKNPQFPKTLKRDFYFLFLWATIVCSLLNSYQYMKHGALFLAPPSPPPTVFFGTKTGASGLNELAGVEDCVLA